MTGSAAPTWKASDQRLWLELPNDRAALGGCRDLVQRFLAARGIAARRLYDVELVLEEALMNIIWHAYADAGRHLISVVIELDAAEISVSIEDDGMPFDPTRALERTPARSIEEAKPGGFGLTLIRAAIRSAAYARIAERNRLTLRLAAI